MGTYFLSLIGCSTDSILPYQGIMKEISVFKRSSNPNGKLVLPLYGLTLPSLARVQ